MQYILNKPTRLVIADFIKQRKIVKALQLAVLYVISKIMKERSVIFKYCLQNYEGAYKIMILLSLMLDRWILLVTL